MATSDPNPSALSKNTEKVETNEKKAKSDTKQKRERKLKGFKESAPTLKSSDTFFPNASTAYQG